MAAEHYQTYFDRVSARRAAGESLEPNVQLQETIARERLERIIHIYGAIHVAPAKRTGAPAGGLALWYVLGLHARPRSVNATWPQPALVEDGRSRGAP